MGFRLTKSLSSLNTPFARLTFLYMRLKRAMRICMPRWCRPKMAGCSRRKRAVNRRQRPRARKYPWLRSGAWNGSKEAMMRPRSWGCTVLEASYNKWWENNKISNEWIWSTFFMFSFQIHIWFRTCPAKHNGWYTVRVHQCCHFAFVCNIPNILLNIWEHQTTTHFFGLYWEPSLKRSCFFPHTTSLTSNRHSCRHGNHLQLH